VPDKETKTAAELLAILRERLQNTAAGRVAVTQVIPGSDGDWQFEIQDDELSDAERGAIVRAQAALRGQYDLDRATRPYGRGPYGASAYGVAGGYGVAGAYERDERTFPVNDGAFAGTAFSSDTFSTPATPTDPSNAGPPSNRTILMSSQEPAAGTNASQLRSGLPPRPLPPEPTLPANSASVAVSLSSSANLSVEAVFIPGPITLSHREMIARLRVLEEIVSDLRSRPSIGHNNPPSAIDVLQIGSEELGNIQSAIDALKVPTVTPEDITRAAQAVSILRTIGDKLWTALVTMGAYTAKQADVFISEFAKTAGAETAKWLIRVMAMSAALSAVTVAAEHWLKLLH